MKKWIIKKNKKNKLIRLERFGIFKKNKHIKLHRRYFIHNFEPITLFRNTIQEIRIGNFWCKLMYRLDDNETIEFVIEDFINNSVDIFKVYSTYVSFVSFIDFEFDIYLDSKNELCRKYKINGINLYPISTYSEDIGSFYKILGPELSKERLDDLVIEYMDL